MISKAKINGLFVHLMLFSCPFINFSLIPNSNLPLTYLVVIIYFFFTLIFSLTFTKRIINKEDFAYIGFLASMFISVLINSVSGLNLSSITQIINLLLTYLIFKVTQNAVYFGKVEKDEILGKWFKFNSIICFFAIILFVLGIVNENIVRFSFNFFNNSGNFSKGGLISSFTEESYARLNSFAPEPSFWGFFTAFNIALGFSLKKRNYILLSITFANLILTVSRTGYLMFGVFLTILLLKKLSTRLKIILGSFAIVALILYGTQLDLSKLMEVDDSFKQRFGSVIVGFKLFTENPIFGIGIGNFQIIAKNMGLDYVDIFSLFVNILLVGGILSGGLFIAFCRKIYYRLTNQHRMIWIVVLVGWLTVSSYNLPYVWVFLGITLIFPNLKSNGLIKV